MQVHLAAKRKSEELSRMSGGDKYGYLKEIHTKHKFKKQKTEEGKNGESVCFNKVVIFQATEFSAIDEEVPSIKLNSSNEIEMQYELLDVEDAKYYKGKNHFTKIADVFFEFRHTSPKQLDWLNEYITITIAFKCVKKRAVSFNDDFSFLRKVCCMKQSDCSVEMIERDEVAKKKIYTQKPYRNITDDISSFVYSR